MKKKLLWLLLVGVLVTGCGENKTNADSNDEANNTGTQEEKVVDDEENQEKEVADEESDIIYMTEQEIRDCFETVDITTDNWEDYFSLNEVHTDVYDAFNEPTGEYAEGILLQPNDNVMIPDEVVFRFQTELCASLALSWPVDSESWVHSTCSFNDDGNIISEPFDITINNYYNHTIRETWQFPHGGSDGNLIEITHSTLLDAGELKDYSLCTVVNVDLLKVEGDVVIWKAPDEQKWNIYDNDGKFLAINMDNGQILVLYENGSWGYNLPGNSDSIKNTINDGENFDEGLFDFYKYGLN